MKTHSLRSLVCLVLLASGLLAGAPAHGAEGPVVRCGDGEPGAVELVSQEANEKYRAVFSGRGGTLACFELLYDQYQQEELKGSVGVVPQWISRPGPMQLVNTWDTRFLPFQFQLSQPEVLAGVQLTRTLVQPVASLADPKGWKAGAKVTADFFDLYRADPIFSLVSAPGDAEAVYVWPNPATDTSDVYVERRLKPLGGHRFRLLVTVYNLGAKALQIQPRLTVTSWETPGTTAGTSIFSPPANIKGAQCQAGGSFNTEPAEALLKEGGVKNPGGATEWVGVSDRYFLLAAVNRSAEESSCQLQAGGNGVLSASAYRPAVTLSSGQSCNPSWLKGRPGVSCDELAKVLGLDAEGLWDRAALEKAFVQKEKELRDAGLSDAAASHIRSSNRLSWENMLFVGPKTIGLLKDAAPTLEESLDFGILAVLSKPMLYIMRWFHDYIPSWALAIIFLTILVKLIMLPLTQKSFLSMQRMTELKPEMDRLREKYGKDRERMNQEVMNLYKREKVNPLGGCLPILLQMPIWIALYRTLYSAVDLYRAPMGLWIHDLSAPDPFFVMPLVLGGLMYVQQKMTPTTMDSQQAKMMLYMMPVMFTVFMLFLPSGLNLYILVNTLLSIAQQYYLKRRFTTGGTTRAA